MISYKSANILFKNIKINLTQINPHLMIRTSIINCIKLKTLKQITETQYYKPKILF